MARRCKICGKRLYKTFGDIGPKCWKRLRHRTKGKKLKKDLFDAARHICEADNQSQK